MWEVTSRSPPFFLTSGPAALLCWQNMETASPGRYRLLRPLGRGGMGEVFLARLAGAQGFSKLVVLKRVRRELVHRDDFLELFTAEARLAAALSHPHIVSVLDFGRDENGYFLAMEYVDGCDLGRLAALAAEREISLPADFLAAVGLALCRALDYAHHRPRPVVHGDVNPQNVLAGRQGELKLADFGLAALATGPARQPLAGKLAYLPPELAGGRRPDQASDLFGIGAVLCELACGRPPWPPAAGVEQSLAAMRGRRPPEIHRLCPHLPGGLARVIDRALEPDRLRRWSTAGEMEQALARVAAAQGLDTGPRQVERLLAELLPATAPAESNPARTLVATVQPGAPGRPRPLSWRTFSTAVALLALAGGGLWWWGTGRRQADRTPSAPGIVAPSRPAPAAARPLPPEHLQVHRGPGEPAARRQSPSPAAAARAPGPRQRPATGTPGGAKTRTAAGVTDRREEQRPARPPVEAADAGSSAAADSPAPPAATVEFRPGPGLTTGEAGAGEQLALAGPRVLRWRRGRELEFTLRLEPAGEGVIELAVRSRPFAILSLDGRPRGLTPLAGMRLGRGRHLLQLAPPHQEPARLELHFRPRRH